MSLERFRGVLVYEDRKRGKLRYAKESTVKVYEMSYGVPDGTAIYWTTSKADAVRVAHQIIEEGPSYAMSDFTIRQVDIPTNRDGLVAWLNSRFQMDNG